MAQSVGLLDDKLCRALTRHEILPAGRYQLLDATGRMRGYAEKWARTYPWVMKLDVEKYFASIDHQVAMHLLGRKIRCPRTLDLFARVIASWRSDEAPPRWFAGDDLFAPVLRLRGLPIGNLTSQFLSNVVLDHVDHAVKDGLGTRAYARYCDDMVAFARSVAELRLVRARVVAALADLRLCLHQGKSQILPVVQGVPWVGFRVGAEQTRMRREAMSRVRRRLRAWRGTDQRGIADQELMTQKMAAMRGHLRSGVTPRMLTTLLAP